MPLSHTGTLSSHSWPGPQLNSVLEDSFDSSEPKPEPWAKTLEMRSARIKILDVLDFEPIIVSMLSDGFAEQRLNGG